MNARAGLETSERAIAAIASVRRAAAVERWSDAGVKTEVRPLAALADIVPAWKALAAQPIEPNVFLDPAFALAASSVLGDDVQAVLVWAQSPRSELLGLFPMRVEHRYGPLLPVLSNWTHPYAPLGVPLVHRDAAERTIRAWLDHIEREPTLPPLLLLPCVNEDGAFARMLSAVLRQRGASVASFDRHRRALLAPTDDRAGYIKQAIATKQRRELARKWRRMQDLGAVDIDRPEDADAVAVAMDDFFRIEASGWKGRVGTAAAIDPAIRGFMLQAVIDLMAAGQARIHCLRIAGRSIAVAITLRSGDTVWGWKVAYDEAYARLSPGVQLLVHLTEDLLADASIAQVDSSATANHPMIDHIWRERRTMADWLIGLNRRSPIPFPLASRLEAARRLARTAAKAVRDRLRARQRAGKAATGAAAE